MAKVKACVFGDRFLVPEFRRAANNNFVTSSKFVNTLELFEVVVYAYDNLPEDITLLEFLVDTHCQSWKVWDECLDVNGFHRRLPRGFLFRAMTRYSRLSCDPFKRLKMSCYVEHTSDEERKECEKSGKVVHLKYSLVLGMSYPLGYEF